ncbi:MAG: hypothetical protein AAB426_01610 [Myxococcota bacterium]
MKYDLEDARVIDRFRGEQRGVFSKSDLQALLGETHPTAFARRLRVLERHHVVRRFVRGWYVAETFDLPTLSQRLAPTSYVSFGRVLADGLIVGTAPEREIMAVKIGRSRTYEGLGYRVIHLGVVESLYFGYEVRDGVGWADAEKATLDVLYFHLRGRRYLFDIYSDIRFDALNRQRVDAYLAHYRNPKLVTFVRNLLGGNAR